MTSVQTPLPAGTAAISESSRHSEELASEGSLIKLKKILVPTDLSPNSEKVLNYAVQLAQLGRPTLFLLRVFEIPEFSGLLPEASSWQLDYVKIKKTFDSAIQRAQDKLTEWADKVREKKIKVVTQLCYEDSLRGNCKDCQERAVELIVITTHGYAGLKHFLLGSTAERVVESLPAPCWLCESRKEIFFQSRLYYRNASRREANPPRILSRLAKSQLSGCR